VPRSQCRHLLAIQSLLSIWPGLPSLQYAWPYSWYLAASEIDHRNNFYNICTQFVGKNFLGFFPPTVERSSHFKLADFIYSESVAISRTNVCVTRSQRAALSRECVSRSGCTRKSSHLLSTPRLICIYLLRTIRPYPRPPFAWLSRPKTHRCSFLKTVSTTILPYDFASRPHAQLTLYV